MKIILTMSEGAINALNIPQGVEVEVRDYEVPDDFDNVEIDSDGDSYQKVMLAGEKRELVKTKYIGLFEVKDPDTGRQTQVEIRKLETGQMVGIDGSYLEYIGGIDPEKHYPLNPYGDGEGLLIPDDELI